MKTLFLSILLITSNLLFSQTAASIDTNEQTISWVGKAAVGGYSPEGTLEILNAQMTYTDSSITSLDIIIDMRSLEQENKDLKRHLRDKDFFHVKKFPVATFTLSEASTFTEDTCLITGNMTIKGITKVETFEVTIQKNDTGIILEFNETMNRVDYGISYNSPSVFKKLKENAIADEFILKGFLMFNK